MTRDKLGNPLVVCANVEKHFGTTPVLQNINLTVHRGETICIIGPSGSGKSTLLRCINALVPVTSGSITVDGIEVNTPKLDKLTLRRKVGIVFQQYNRTPDGTLHELPRKAIDTGAGFERMIVTPNLSFCRRPCAGYANPGNGLRYRLGRKPPCPAWNKKMPSAIRTYMQNATWPAAYCSGS